MTAALIVIATILALIIVIFVTWFLAMKADGKCPLCILKSLGRSKLHIGIKDVDDYDNGVSSSPIMGWSSWNTLRNRIDEDSIYDTAKVLVDTGLADAGYRYVNIDDCWQSSMRDADGKLQGDLETFPSGMEALCKRINSLGLKMGLYSSNGTHTCEDMPASLGNEELDAKTIASWGVEYWKYDFCHHQNLSGSVPIIEYIDLNQRGYRSQYKLTPSQAEFTGRAKVVKCNDLESKKGIGFLNHGAGTASFTFDVEDGGEYIMTIHSHKNLLNRKQYLQVIVNGKLYEAHFPSGRSFTPEARLQLEIELKDGENTILLQNPIVSMADSSYTCYKRMGDALKEATKAWALYTHSEEKPITYSICEWGFAHPWNWGVKAGNMWRTTMDIFPKWRSIAHIYKQTIKLYKHASPGHVNDPDMLEVGNGKLSVEENKSHFALWCMMAAPLVLGNDIRLLQDGSKKSAVILDILTNKSLILIDQDPLVKPAKRVSKQGSIDILARPLANGDTALCFFNKGSKPKPIEYNLDALKDDKYVDFERSGTGYEIHDLFSGDRIRHDTISTSVPKHGVKVYRISK